MSSPEFVFIPQKEYFKHQQNHIQNFSVREGMFYTAYSKLEGEFAHEEAVTFPVSFETINFTKVITSENPAGTLAIKMTLLDADLRPSNILPITTLIENGIWEVNTPIPIPESGTHITKGYLVFYSLI